MFARNRMTRRGRLRSQKGQALVEFALVLPILLIMILGIVDFGLAYNYKNDETHLANEAIRFAVVNHCGPCGPGQKIEDFVKADADTADLRNGGGQIDTPGVKVCFSFPGDVGTGVVGDALTATVISKYNFLPSLVTLVGLPNQVTLKATATQRLEQDHDFGSSVYHIKTEAECNSYP